MADNRITLDVGGKFNGEFLDNLNKGINTSKKEMGSAKAGLGALMGAMNEISPAAANAVGGVKNLVGAFAAGGIVGGAIELAVRGIGEGVKFVTKHLEEAKERATAFAQILRDDIIGAASSANDKFKGLRDTMTEVAKESAAAYAAMNGDVTNVTNMDIQDIRAERNKKLANAETENERKIIESEYAIEVATVRLASVREIAANKEKESSEKVASAQEKQQAASDAVAEVNKTLAEYQDKNASLLRKREKLDHYANASIEELTKEFNSHAQATKISMQAKLELKKFDEEHKDVVAGLNEITKQQAESSKQLSSANAELAAAQKTLKALQNENVVKIKTAMNDLEEARQKRKEISDNEFDAMVEHAQRQGEENALIMERMLEEKAEAKRAQKRAEAEEKREAAENAAAEKREKEEKLKKEGENARVGAGAVANVRIDQGQLAEMVNQKNFDAIKATVKTVRQVQREAYQLQRARRTQENKIIPELTHYYSLMRKPENFLSDFDKRWMQSYKEGVLPGLVEQLGPERMKELTEAASGKMLDATTELNRTTAAIKNIIDKCTTK